MRAFYKTTLHKGEEYISVYLNLEVTETEDSFTFTFPEILTDKLRDENFEIVFLDDDVGKVDATFETELNNEGELEVVDE